MSENPFVLLDLSALESYPGDEAIEAAFRRVALRWHPDKHANSEPELRAKAAVEFERISRARGALLDPAAREIWLKPKVHKSATACGSTSTSTRRAAALSRRRALFNSVGTGGSSKMPSPPSRKRAPHSGRPSVVSPDMLRVSLRDVLPVVAFHSGCSTAAAVRSQSAVEGELLNAAMRCGVRPSRGVRVNAFATPSGAVGGCWNSILQRAVWLGVWPPTAGHDSILLQMCGVDGGSGGDVRECLDALRYTAGLTGGFARGGSSEVAGRNCAFSGLQADSVIAAVTAYDDCGL